VARPCYAGAECDSGLCVDGQCVCPLLYSGPGCANVTHMPTKERSNATDAARLHDLRHAPVPFAAQLPAPVPFAAQLPVDVVPEPLNHFS
jgi:hypothetical protein